MRRLEGKLAASKRTQLRTDLDILTKAPMQSNSLLRKSALNVLSQCDVQSVPLSEEQMILGGVD